MKGNMSTLDWITFVLVMIGALNWGLVGAAGINVVEYLGSTVARIVYVLVGLSAIYAIAMVAKKH